jgi:lipopolysaccharide biosynthesis glycosyltransferase
MTLVNKKDLIVTLADANFVDQAKQLFSSVYFKAGWAGDYLLLTNNLSDLDRAWFENKGIIVYNQPLISKEAFSEKAYPPLLFSKFYLFTRYFKKWRKVIFLDADIIVRGSLEELATVR